MYIGSSDNPKIPRAISMLHTCTARLLLARMLRITLAFALAFFVTLHVEYRLAFGEEGTGPTGTQQAQSTSNTTNNGTIGDSHSNEEQVASYSFIESIQILKEDGEPLTTDEHKLVLKGKVPYEYGISARVTVVFDSNNEGSSKQVLLCTPEHGLAELTDGQLHDLSWEIYTEVKRTHEEGEAEGSSSLPSSSLSSSSSSEREDELKRVAVPTNLAHIDKATGLLTVESETEFIVRCWTDEARWWPSSSNGSFTEGTLTVETTIEEEEEESSQPPTDPFQVSFNANGADGSMEPIAADENGQVTLPENTFTPQEGKEFYAWGTHEIAESGQIFEPGQTFEPKEDTVLFALWKDAEHETEPEPKPSDEGQQDTGPHVRLTYTPAPLGQLATISPVISGVGHIQFEYWWQRSTDGGTTWEFVESTSLESMQIPVTEETLGHLYRVSVVSTDVLDKDTGSHVMVSDPVEIAAADSDFLVYLSFTAVETGQVAQLSITCTERDATFEWQVLRYGENTWETIEGEQGTNYAVLTSEETLGSCYRVKATRKIPAGEESSSASLDSREQIEEKISNVVTLVGVVPESEAEPMDDLLTENDIVKIIGQDEYDRLVREAEEAEAERWREHEVNIVEPDTIVPDPALEPEFEPEPEFNFEPTPEYESEYDPEATLEPQPETSAQPQEASDYSAMPTDVIVDPAVSESIALEAAENQTELKPEQPGSRWKELDVIPKPEQIAEVLDQNPFAPFALPFGFGLMACGMVEKLFWFRRQTHPSAVSFKHT